MGQLQRRLDASDLAQYRRAVLDHAAFFHQGSAQQIAHCRIRPITVTLYTYVTAQPTFAGKLARHKLGHRCLPAQDSRVISDGGHVRQHDVDLALESDDFVVVNMNSHTAQCMPVSRALRLIPIGVVAVNVISTFRGREIKNL